MIKPGLEFVYEAEGALGMPVQIGETPDGPRRIIPIIEGGRVEGPLVKGAMFGSGADWQLSGSDASGYMTGARVVIDGGEMLENFR